MVPQNKLFFDTEKVSTSSLSNEICEADLSRFLTFKQGFDFFFNHGKPLSVIVGETIPLNELVRRFQVFFNPPTIDG